MNRIFKLTVITITLATLAGCSMFDQINGSGNAVDSRYVFNDFTAVSVSETCDLIVTQGDHFSIIITSDDNVAEYVEVKETEETLYIGLKSGYSYDNIIFEARVTMPDLKGLSVKGASKAQTSGFYTTGTVNVSVEEASEVSMDYERTGAVNASVDGASELIFNTQTVSGSVKFNSNGASYLKFTAPSGNRNANINCDGASHIDMKGFTAGNAVVELGGASNVWVNLTETLSGSIKGASVLRYRGTSSLDLDIELASSASGY